MSQLVLEYDEATPMPENHHLFGLVNLSLKGKFVAYVNEDLLK